MRVGFECQIEESGLIEIRNLVTQSDVHNSNFCCSLYLEGRMRKVNKSNNININDKALGFTGPDSRVWVCCLQAVLY
jgi:hypothetical protein